ncbi:glycosyltransferase family 39 protein [Polyangium jinanense]|uniref:hypothetical protein n=1 Tax=Polyangium jinanense TaxID=2829994 RepID=UPI0023415424|nr:hypothetical protein [Polyangium jinanense]MDC3958602.1 glycosyltransferase family 39 protein [Polyangium jinanense]
MESVETAESVGPPAQSGRLARLRQALVTLALVAGIGVFGWVVHQHYPIPKWLFWRYAGYWLGTLVVGIASYGLGHVALHRVFRVRMPLLEHAMVSMALGVYGFEILMFIIGLLGLYRTATFFVLPVALLAAVALPLYQHALHIRRVFARSAPTRPKLGPAALALAFGLLGLGMIYFYVITPSNIQFDSRWKHLALAEQYVVQGAIRPAVEGWVFTARPHFTSYLYTWAFLVPGRLFDKMTLAAHLEFGLFVMTTVVGIPALVRRLVPRADPRWIWAARFLFPGVLLYDSSVCGGADHVGAMFGTAVVLVLFRALRDLDLRYVSLLGVLCAAAALTKETVAIMLVPAPLALVVIRGAMLGVQSFRGRAEPNLGRRWLVAPLLLGGVGLAASSPLWLKNFLFYGDPFYPLLGAKLHAHPFTDQAAYRFKYGYAEGLLWKPTRDLKGLLQTLVALVDFSFVPNDWPKFHGKVPVFGSMFTLLLGCLPFLKKAKRIWLVVLLVHVGIFIWYSVHHQDRYLQALMPYMAAVTAAIALSVWRSFGTGARVALATLFGLQIVWGGDVYFIQTHAHARSPLKNSIDLLSAGFEKKHDARFGIQQHWQEVGQATPPQSRLLLHIWPDHHAHLGTMRHTVLDAYLWQFGVEYGAAGSTEGVRTMLRDLGVTHVLAEPDKESDGANSIAADLLFWDFATHLRERKTIGQGLLGKVPEEPIQAPFDDLTAVLSCTAKAPAKGLFHVRDLRVLPFGPIGFPAPIKPAKTKEEAEALLAHAHFVVLEEGCKEIGKPAGITRAFDLVTHRRRYGPFNAMELYRRRPGLSAIPLPP